MKRINIIGCAGSGKSTLGRMLSKDLDIPLYHLDMLWHKPDRTTVSENEFVEKLQEIIKQDSWIIDGNYLGTLNMRLEVSDTVFLLDLPLNVCLESARSRIGKKRPDLPWIEEEFDEEFEEWIKSFKETQLPTIYKTLDYYKDKIEVVVFHSREEINDYFKGEKDELVR